MKSESILPATDYVSLSRRFLDGSTSGFEDENDSIWATLPSEERGETWEKILENDISVLLGTAGSGKTTEVRQQVRVLEEAGKNAFLLRLEALQDGSTANAFDFDLKGQAEKFEKWKSTGKGGVLFLDALDEARLPSARNVSALEMALNVVSREVIRRQSPLRLVVTSRPSEWFGDRDERLLKTFIRRKRYTTHDGSANEPSLKIFQMGALNTTDIKKLANSRGINPAEFLEAVNANLLSGLIQQPLDADMFLGVWKKAKNEGRASDQIFKSRCQVMNDLVTWRLEGRQENRERVNIDISKARRAVAKLAAFGVVSAQQDLTVKELADEEVSVAQILADNETSWTGSELRELLTCGLFQPSVGGRIRFAHRELRDFLAAEHFDRSMRSRAHSEQTIGVLFAEGIGPRSIPQSTEHVLGWLSTFNSRVREIVAKTRPALLIETGDPLALSLGDKELVLRNYAKLYETLNVRPERVNRGDIKRFAHGDLSTIVGELLDKSSSLELTDFLIKVARIGDMKPLATKLASYVTNPDIEYHTKGEACAALFEIGDTTHRARVLAAVLTDECPDLNGTDAARTWNMFQLKALRYCFEEAPLLDCIFLLARLQSEPSNSLPTTSHYLIEVLGQVTIPGKRSWLTILLRFAFVGRSEDCFPTPITSERYQGFVRAIIFLASVLVSCDDTNPDDPDMLDAVEIALSYTDLNVYLNHKAPTRSLVDGLRMRPDIKYRLVDRRIALFADRKRNGRVPYFAIHSLTLYKWLEMGTFFEKSDVLHYCKLAGKAANQSKRTFLLNLALTIQASLDGCEKSDAWDIYLKYLRKFGDAEQRSQFGIRGRLRRLLHRVLHQHQYEVLDWLGKQSERLQCWRSVKRKQRIFRRERSDILAGEISDADAYWLYNKSPDSLGPGTICSIRKDYGVDVAEMLTSGIREYWKTHDACYSDGRTYPSAIGLAGINLDHSLNELPTDTNLVRKAFRFSFHELNGFPVWVDELSRKFPSEFCSEVKCALLEDFSKPKENNDHHTSDCISMIANSSNYIRNLVGPLILKMMMKSMPENPRDRMLCLDIAARAPKTEQNCLSRFLVLGFKQAWTQSDFPETWVWLDALLNANSREARNIFCTYFEDLEGADTANLFFEFLGRDEDKPSLEVDSDLVRSEYERDPLLLEWLVRAAFLVWPPEKDVVRERLYSPRKADYATRNRRGYVRLLGAIHTAEAHDSFRRLAKSKELKDYRDEFLLRIDLMVRVAGRRPNLSPFQTIQFLNDHSKAPSSVAEFRKLCNTHLETLLEKLHQSDDDEGAYYRRGSASEDDLRNWMAARLRDVGEHYYTVIREQEVAGEKRTDIRLYSQTDSLGNVSVEIKLADMDHWSGDQLVNTPDEQISRRYLLDPSSHTGIYVLVNAAKPRNKEVDDKGNIKRKEFSKKVAGTPVNFENLVEAVKEKCKGVNDGLKGDKVVSLIARDISEKPSEMI